MFVMKEKLDGYVYIFMDSGIYRIRLDDKSFFSEESIKTAKEDSKGYIYPLEIGGKKLSVASHRRAGWAKEETLILRSESETTKVLDHLKEKKDPRMKVYPETKPIKLSRSDAEAMTNKIIRNQALKLADSRELTEHDQSPDCSYWENFIKNVRTMSITLPWLQLRTNWQKLIQVGKRRS